MSFFHTHASKHSNWLFFAIGLGLATIVSAGTVIYVNSHSKQPSPIPDTTIIDKVLVIKSQRVLKLLSGDTVIQSYKISLGANPVGHKQQKGTIVRLQAATPWIIKTKILLPIVLFMSAILMLLIRRERSYWALMRAAIL